MSIPKIGTVFEINGVVKVSTKPVIGLWLQDFKTDDSIALVKNHTWRVWGPAENKITITQVTDIGFEYLSPVELNQNFLIDDDLFLAESQLIGFYIDQPNVLIILVNDKWELFVEYYNHEVVGFHNYPEVPFIKVTKDLKVGELRERCYKRPGYYNICNKVLAEKMHGKDILKAKPNTLSDDEWYELISEDWGPSNQENLKRAIVNDDIEGIVKITKDLNKPLDLVILNEALNKKAFRSANWIAINSDENLMVDFHVSTGLKKKILHAKPIFDDFNEQEFLDYFNIVITVLKRGYPLGYVHQLDEIFNNFFISKWAVEIFYILLEHLLLEDHKYDVFLSKIIDLAIKTKNKELLDVFQFYGLYKDNINLLDLVIHSGEHNYKMLSHLNLFNDVLKEKSVFHAVNDSCIDCLEYLFKLDLPKNLTVYPVEYKTSKGYELIKPDQKTINWLRKHHIAYNN